MDTPVNMNDVQRANFTVQQGIPFSDAFRQTRSGIGERPRTWFMPLDTMQPGETFIIHCDVENRDLVMQIMGAFNSQKAALLRKGFKFPGQLASRSRTAEMEQVMDPGSGNMRPGKPGLRIWMLPFGTLPGRKSKGQSKGQSKGHSKPLLVTM